MPEPRIWLLLAGINFYPNEAQRLRGAVNDVRNIELSLKKYFKDINVTKLLASVTGKPSQIIPPEEKHLWPTWDNFNCNIKCITKKASAGDIVWIYYSGHGTLRSTKTTEFVYHEGYGTDAALALLEPTGREGIRYLRGIELARLLDGMVHKGLKLTVVLDSCYSGSISRDEDSVIRGIPWSVDVDSEFPLDVPSLPQSLVQKNVLRDTKSASHWLLHPQGYTLLAACGPHEVAKEIKIGQQVQGVLSFLMCKAFESCAKEGIQDTTHETIYRYVSANMSIRFRRQHPILTGTKNTTLWGAEVTHLDARSTFEIIQGSADREIWINAGLIHGVCTGDEYKIYTHAGAKEPITGITITDVEAVHSVAKNNSVTGSEADSSQIRNGYRAILSKLARPRAYVKLDSGIDDFQGKAFRESIWLQYLPSDEKASVDVPYFSVVKSDSQQYTILDFKNDRILNLPPLLTENPSVGDQIFILLEHLSRYTFVQNLDNRRMNGLTNSDFTITVKPQAGYFSPDDSKSNVTVPHDSKVEIEFRNLTEEVLHVAVMDLAQFRRIKHIYPPHKEYQSVMPLKLEKVAPDVSDITPPGMIRFAVSMTVPTRLKEKQQSYVATEDLLKFIVSTEPINGTKSLELPDLWDAVEHGAATVRSADEAFGASVQESLVEKSRGLGQSGGEETIVKWACRTITICTVLEAN